MKEGSLHHAAPLPPVQIANTIAGPAVAWTMHGCMDGFSRFKRGVDFVWHSFASHFFGNRDAHGIGTANDLTWDVEISSYLDYTKTK